VLARIRLRGQLQRMVVVHSGRIYTSEQMFSPVFRNAGALADQLGVLPELRSWEYFLEVGDQALEGIDILGVMLDFNMPAEKVEQIVERVLRPATKKGIRTVLFDGDDDVSIRWGNALAAVDVCVKKHIYADRNRYADVTIGKSNLTDYVAKQYGADFSKDLHPAAGGHDLRLMEKLRVGWNIALDDKIFELKRDLPKLDHAAKDLDVLCRAVVPERMWTFPMRNCALEQVSELSDAYRVLAPKERCTQDEYYRELLRTRICVSPFGFGELCWRDFECVLAGALLVKPDMGHVETEPNIFVPYETYVPVAWDYSNLREVCDRYLNDETERRRVAANAYRMLNEGLSKRWFVERFRNQVLEPLQIR